LQLITLNFIQTHTIDKTPLDDRSARRRYLNVTRHKRHTRMLPAGFKTPIPANERPQTHTWDII